VVAGLFTGSTEEWDAGPQGKVVMNISGDEVLIFEGIDSGTIQRFQEARQLGLLPLK